MFTGIVEEVGEVVFLNPERLSIRCSRVLEGTVVGDSISVNGVCLTVVDIKKDMFSVDVMPETMKVSALKNLKVHDRVNLERAMRLSDRFGGHIVTGHIDGVGRIVDIVPCGNAEVISVIANMDVLRYIITKGSVALDGISLTVVSVGSDRFSVSIIPHTRSETCLRYKKIGDVLNIECDVVGKYVEKFVVGRGHGITYEFLRENGF